MSVVSHGSSSAMRDSFELSRHILPLLRLRALEHRVADALGFQGISKRRAGGFAGLQALDEIGYLVDEGVFVTELEAGDPPVLHVRMFAVGGVDGLPAAKRAFVAGVEIFEAMEIVEVPVD